MTPVEVARHLQVSERKVFQWLREGQLLGLKIGNRWRTSRRHVSSFLEAHANRPPPNEPAVRRVRRAHANDR